MRWIYLPDVPGKSGFVLVWIEMFYHKTQAAAFYDANTKKFYCVGFDGNGDVDSCRFREIDTVVKWCGLCTIADKLNWLEYKDRSKKTSEE